jgi:hypothetical protein
VLYITHRLSLEGWVHIWWLGFDLNK